MAAYTVGFMTHVTCRLTAKNQDQLKNPTLGNRVWVYLYLFYCLSERVFSVVVFCRQTILICLLILCGCPDANKS